MTSIQLHQVHKDTCTAGAQALASTLDAGAESPATAASTHAQYNTLASEINIISPVSHLRVQMLTGQSAQLHMHWHAPKPTHTFTCTPSPTTTTHLHMHLHTGLPAHWHTHVHVHAPQPICTQQGSCVTPFRLCLVIILLANNPPAHATAHWPAAARPASTAPAIVQHTR